MNPLAFADALPGTLSNTLDVMQLGQRHARRIADEHVQAYMRRAADWQTSLAKGLTSPSTDWQDYVVDAAQRSVLVLDALRRRGDAYTLHQTSGMPPVLDYGYEPVIDGRTLPRPVNYSLVKVLPPETVTIDPAKRPFMIVDPRAGHGAGIGGFKPESQVGEAFEDGHAVYFVIFRPWPEPGQTLADIRDAEKAFVEEIRRRHADAAKPVVIGNCQGGWASMLLAATEPDVVGPVAVNGAPMSYWAGKVGGNPMRYLGGLSGGAAPVLFMSDLGNGVFDGSLLVQNFEGLNPANTYWKKLYNLYSQVDTETERFLEFERWWGGFFMMNEEEIRWILEHLFVGNRLAHGQALLGGKQVDLRDIKAPIIVFASHGDNITPPQQALNWIPDTYRDVNEIKARGQRIVYILHDTIGHLGIFVSAKIAGREHDAITDTMRAVEALPPGLYEMGLETQPDRVHIKFAPRTIEDILKLDDGRGDEEMFSAVAQFSEYGVKAYETFARPLVKRLVDERSAKRFFETRPLRLERTILSSDNPIVAPVENLAGEVRAARKVVAPDNPFLVAEKLMAAQIEQNLNLFRDMRDAWQELAFHAIWGSPLMRMVGAEGLAKRSQAVAENLLTLPDVRAALDRIEEGGAAAGMVRMLQLLAEARGYVRRTRLERQLEVFKTEEPFSSMDDTARARLIHEQSLIVQFAPDRAKDSLPTLLRDEADRARALDLVMQLAGPEDTMHPAALELYREFEEMLGRSRPGPVPADASEPAQPIAAE